MMNLHLTLTPAFFYTDHPQVIGAVSQTDEYRVGPAWHAIQRLYPGCGVDAIRQKGGFNLAVDERVMLRDRGGRDLYPMIVQGITLIHRDEWAACGAVAQYDVSLEVIRTLDLSKHWCVRLMRV
ncbi:MAG: hypothetical protein MUF87_18425 [Anaerolineae bacterium]|jgi:hypothetical protein|nr:hypothetical protein [Anaerolineae bacterium]